MKTFVVGYKYVRSGEARIDAETLEEAKEKIQDMGEHEDYEGLGETEYAWDQVQIFDEEGNEEYGTLEERK